MGIESTLDKILTELTSLVKEIKELRGEVLNRNAVRIKMSTADVVRELGITPKTIIQYEKLGVLKSYRVKPGGRKYFRRDEVDGFLNSGRKRKEE